MRLKLNSTTVASLLALLLSACGSTPPYSTEIPSTIDSRKISAEAQAALTQAENDVSLARAKFALWTTAEAALRSAQEAAAAGDSAGVLRHAAFASSQVRLGLEQLTMPTTERK